MAELLALFDRATEGFGQRVHRVAAGAWHDPTPDTEWDVRMLVNHLVVEQLWVPALVEGQTVAEIGGRLDGDHMGIDPVAAWDSAVAASRAAFAAPGVLDGTVTLSRGVTPTVEYLREMTTDALIHTWDLARAIGDDETLDPELVAIVHEAVLPIAEHLHETGLFAPVVPVPDDAPLQVRLLGLFGRAA